MFSEKSLQLSAIDEQIRAIGHSANCTEIDLRFAIAQKNKELEKKYREELTILYNQIKFLELLKEND
jgi:hypothetical protein